MRLKKALRKYGGVVGNLATGNIRGAFPVIAQSIDAFNSPTSFSGQVNDDEKKRPKYKFY